MPDNPVVTVDLIWDLILALLVGIGGGAAIAMVLLSCGIGVKARNKPAEIIQLDEAKRHRRRAF